MFNVSYTEISCFVVLSIVIKSRSRLLHGAAGLNQLVNVLHCSDYHKLVSHTSCNHLSHRLSHPWSPFS